jgi:hypothetical protein
MYLEYKSLHAARERLSFYGLQRAALMAARASGRVGSPIVHYNIGISTISDNYITEVCASHNHTHGPSHQP